MKNCLLVVLFLVIVSNAFGRTHYFATKRRIPLKPNTIEIVKWHQPVCVVPANVSCHFQQKIQFTALYKHLSAKSEPDEIKPIQTEILYHRVGPFEPSESINEELTDLDKTLELPSETLEMGVKWQSIIRSEPHNSIISTRKHISTKKSRIYVTRVLNLPMMTYRCSVNTSYPLCADYQASLSPKTIKMEEDKLNHSKPHEDQRSPNKLNEESHSKVIDEPTSRVNHKLEINTTEPIKLDHKFEINTTVPSKDYKRSSLYFDLMSTFEKLNKIRDSSDTNENLYKLIEKRTADYLSIFHTPLIDLLLPESTFDKFWKKKNYSKDVEDPCDKARRTSVLRFELNIGEKISNSEVIKEIEACLQDMKLRIKQSTIDIGQKSRIQSTESNVGYESTPESTRYYTNDICLKNNSNVTKIEQTKSESERTTMASLQAIKALKTFTLAEIPHETEGHISNKPETSDFTVKKNEEKRLELKRANRNENINVPFFLDEF